MEEGRVRIVICCALALLLIVIGGVGYGVAQIAPPEDDSECLQSWDDLLKEYLEFRENSYLLVAPTCDVTPKAIRSWQKGEEDPQLDPYWFWHFEGGIRYFNRASKLGATDFCRILIYEDVLKGEIVIMSCDPDSDEYREEIVYTAPLPEKKSADKTWARHLYEEFARRRIVFSVTMRNYRRAKSEYLKEQESADTELVSRAMATRSSGSYTGVWISIEGPGQGAGGVEVTVHVPEDYTNAVEVYTFEAQTTNRFEGMDSIWAMGTNDLIPGTNHTVTWTLPDIGSHNVFLAAGLQAVDDDSDGISDGKELFVVKSNPGLSDSDFDGIDDGWEVLYELNPCQHNSGEDADQDGFSNLEEYTADCDPTDPDDTPFAAVYVSASAASGDGSWSNPVPTIAEGIALADTGQVVVLLPGVYRGAGNLGLNIANRSLSLRGCNFDGQETILDGQHYYGGFSFSGTGTEEVELYNLEFTRIDNGVLNSSDISFLALERCNFRNAVEEGWNYIVLNNDASMTDCIIENNSVWDWNPIITLYDGNLEIRNSLFRNNQALDENSAYISAELIEVWWGDVKIDHCNFISNSMPISYCLTISNSIVWGNRNLESFEAVNCCLQADTPGYNLEANNIFGDPMLAGDGISLRPESICIDAAADSTNVDFTGEARWDYPYQTNRIGAADIGMDEYVDQNLVGLPDYWASVNGLSPTATPSGDDEGDGIININEYIGGTHPGREDTDNDGITDYDETEIYLTDPLNPDSDEDNCPDSWELQFGLDPLDYSDGAIDHDGDSFGNVFEAYWGTSPNSSNSVPVVSNYYVDLYAASNGIGTRESPFKSIQAAVDHAEEYSIIWLNDGKYGGINGKFSTRGKALIVSSINGAGSCILDGRNVLNGIDVNMGEGNTVVLRGLTIRGADDYAINADGNSPVIERCLIEKTTGSGSSSTPIRFNNGNPLILNCTIANNCTPNANYGGYIPLGKARFVNSVLADNAGIEDLINTNRAILENCCLDFEFPGSGNILDADPVESSILQCHLRQDASCIDGGQEITVSQDQDGEVPWDHPGYAGPSIIDIGVDEYRDSDEDGLPDWWETQNGLNPNSSADALLDSDGDVLSNLAEYQQALNPNLKDNPADSDGDGMPDWWENDSGLNASLNDADSDNDGDGADNIVEWQFGTSPTNAADAVVIVNGVRARVVENWNVFRTDPLVFTNTPGSPEDIADIYQKIVTLSGYQNITGN